MKHAPRTSKNFVRTLALATLVATLAACTPRIASVGNELDPERLADVTVGEHTRQDIEEILGSPSSIATFGQESWYYVSEKSQATAFFEPEVISRTVTIIRFGNDGTVSEVANLGAEDGRVVEPVDRVTPTAGNELTFIEQMMANLGRFNRKK